MHPTTKFFAARSHTRERIEYVQDTELPPAYTEASASVSAATVALLVKVHAEEGSRLTFGLKGHILESIVSAPQPHTDAQDHEDDTKDNANKDSVGVEQQQQSNQSLSPHDTQGFLPAAQQSDMTLAITMTSTDESTGAKSNGSGSCSNSLKKSSLSRQNSLGPDSRVGAWSSKTSLGTYETESSTHSVSLFFVEVNSETELQEICQGSDFDRQVKVVIASHEWKECDTPCSSTYPLFFNHRSKSAISQKWTFSKAHRSKILINRASHGLGNTLPETVSRTIKWAGGLSLL